MQKTPETYTYKNQTVAYYHVGHGRPLIVLHGWGSSSEVMLPVAGRLSDLRGCYLLDLPGFGSSIPPRRPWTIDDYADLVSQFITDRELGVADLLAHSFGGRIALKLCSRDEETTRIDKVLITGGAGMKPKRSMQFYLKKYSAKLIKAPFYLLPPSLRDNGLNKLRQSPLWKSMGSSDYQKLDGVMRTTFVNTVTEHLEDTLPEIPQEVLLLWGRNDTETPLYQAERMLHGLRNAQLEIIDHAGHYAFLNRPNAFTDHAREFFGADSDAAGQQLS